MKRLTVYIIGILILFGSLYSVPATAMADEGNAMQHCSLCTEEEQSMGQCDPAESEDDQQATVSIIANEECDCNIGQAGHSEPTGVLFSNAQTSKGKVFVSLVTQEEWHVAYKNRFVRSNLINAPPAFFLLSLATIQQLK